MHRVAVKPEPNTDFNALNRNANVLLNFRSWSIPLTLVAACSLLDFFQALNGDQSLFLIGAHALRNGAVLYRDFWDIKQPGIYAIYFLATSVGSYSAISLHAFELFYFLIFAIVLIVAARQSRLFYRSALLLPITILASYYIGVGSYEDLQVEGLVSFPLFLTMWFFLEGEMSEDIRKSMLFYAAGGFVATLVLSFKILFLPIVSGLLLVSLLKTSRNGKAMSLSQTCRSIAAVVVGGAVPMALILTYFISHGALNEAIETSFGIPPKVILHAHHQPLSSLWGGLKWFTHRFGSFCILSLFGCFVALKRGLDQFGLALLTWLVTGVSVILLQVTSWYQYQWLLILPPIGAFAALGAFEIYHLANNIDNQVKRTTALIGISILCWALPVALAFNKIRLLNNNSFALSVRGRESYRRAESPIYKGSREDATMLTKPGSLYVIGNPTYYTATGELQALPINGSSIQLLLPTQWQILERDFSVHPPRFVYISNAISHELQPSSPTFFMFFKRHYTLEGKGVLGNLYIKRSKDRT